MPKNPVGWFEIYVQDMERAQKFYETVLQLKLEKLENPLVEMMAFPMDTQGAGASGALAKIKGVASGGNSTLVYFMCDDCAVEGSRIAGAGGRIEHEKMDIGEYGFIVLAYDTEGNMFGLHSMQ